MELGRWILGGIRYLQVEASFGNAWIVQSNTGCFDDGIVALRCVVKSSNGVLNALLFYFV